MFVFDQTLNAVNFSLDKGLDQNKHAFFQTLFIVDQYLEFTLLNILWFLSSPYIDDVLHLVTFAVVHQFVEQLHQSLSFDVACVLVTALQMGKQTFFFQLAKKQSFECVCFHHWFHPEVVLREINQQLTYIFRFFVHIIDELRYAFIFVFEGNVFPELLWGLLRRHKSLSVICDQLFIMALSSFTSKG